MASTWSALKIELLETGQNSGTWGTATNVNLGDAVLGEAITGSATVDFASDADVTVTLTDSATTQAARNLRLNITESSTGIGSVRNLILGSGCQIEKFYLINNTGTGAKTVKNTSGTGISVPAGKATLVYNNGTNVVDAASYFTSLTLGSALPVASGGTGLTAGTSGGILGYTATGTLASSVALTANALVLGAGAGATPTPMASLGTTTTVLHGNVSGAPTFGAVSLTADITGTLPTANGGTNLGGATPFTSGGVVYASSTSALATGSGLTFNGTNEFKILAATGTAYNRTESTQYSTFAQHFAASGNTGVEYKTAYRFVDTDVGELMRLTSTGLGIGTSSPAYKLDLLTSANFAGRWANATRGGYLYLDSGGPGIFNTAAYGGEGIYFHAGSNYTAFLTNSAERARIDSSGNVGIATTNATRLLEIGTGSVTKTAIGQSLICLSANSGNVGYVNEIGFGGSGATNVQSAIGNIVTNATAASNGALYFATRSVTTDTAPTERMRITSAGDVGIGTTSPSTILDIGANNSTPKTITLRYSSVPTYLSSTYDGSFGLSTFSINSYNTSNGSASWSAFGNTGYTSSAIQLASDTNGSQIRFLTASAVNTAPTERARIDSSGNLCVGSTAAGNAGTVNVSVGLAGTTAGGLQLWASTTQTHVIQWGDGTTGSDQYRGYIEYAHNGDSMRFGTAATEKMRLDATNGLQVGTTAGNSGANGLHVTGNIYQGAAGLSQQQITITGGNAIQSQVLGVGYTALLLNSLGGEVYVGTSSSIQLTRYSFYSASGRIIGLEDASGGTGTQQIRFVSAGNNCGTISTSTTATSYNTSSDYRLKENVQPIQNALVKVSQLKPCTYTWKLNGSSGEGFIAHELAEVCPQAVNGKKDAVDEDGSPDYQSVDTSFLVATLTAAIQEQQTIIESLKARLDAANL